MNTRKEGKKKQIEVRVFFLSLFNPMNIRSSSSRSSLLLSPLLQHHEDCLTSSTMHGRASRNAGHRGRRNAEPFAAAYDDADDSTAINFVAASTLLPSLADHVAVPQGEQRWLRFDSRGSASYIEKVDKHALVTSLQLPARDLVMVREGRKRSRFFFLQVFFRKKQKLTTFVSFFLLSSPASPPPKKNEGQPACTYSHPALDPDPRARARRRARRAAHGHRQRPGLPPLGAL